ncbi:hypothetical protein KEM55_000786 [Ascosphaera atra]|nr:hypothetical protein KEM55_000786 [Ascosphaera atra]
MWWYLESDFSESDALRNPFGAGEIVSLYADSLPIVKVPTIAVLTREECAKENVDTEEEKKYGELMRRERKALLVVAEKEAKAKKNNGNGNGNGRSDSQSPAKERRSSADNFPTLNKLLNDNDDEVIEDSDAAKIHSVAGSSAEGRGSAAPAQAGLKLEAEERALQLPARHYLRTSRDSTTDITPDALTMSKGVQKEVRAQLNLPATGDPLPITVQAGAPSTSTPVTETKPTTTATNATNTARRSRPMTQHQLALAETRRQRVEHVLALKRAEKIREIRDKRKEAEAQTSTIARTTRLLEQLPPDYDTDDEGETTTTTTTTTVCWRAWRALFS